MDSKEKKMEKSKRIKHTTCAHGEDTWNVMCARQTHDLSHACACHLLCNTVKMWTCEVCCSQINTSPYLSNHGLPSISFSIFPDFKTKTADLHTSLTSSKAHYSFHTSCIDTRWPQHTTPFDASFPHFLIHENQFFLWLRLELFTVFPFSTPKCENSLQTARVHTPLLTPDGLSLLSFPP